MPACIAWPLGDYLEPSIQLEDAPAAAHDISCMPHVPFDSGGANELRRCGGRAPAIELDEAQGGHSNISLPWRDDVCNCAGARATN
eukprot:233521-Prorocentrum_lima.AAC.1